MLVLNSSGNKDPEKVLNQRTDVIALSLQFPWQPKSNTIYLFYCNLTSCALTLEICELFQRNLMTLGWAYYESHKSSRGPQLSLRDKALPHCSVIWKRSQAGWILNCLLFKALRYPSRKTWQSLLRKTGTQGFSKEGFIQEAVKIVRRTEKAKAEERYHMLPRSLELQNDSWWSQLPSTAKESNCRRAHRHYCSDPTSATDQSLYAWCRSHGSKNFYFLLFFCCVTCFHWEIVKQSSGAKGFWGA